MEVFSISEFLIKSLMSMYCHSSRTINNIGMKLELLIKLDKRNTTASKKIEADDVLTNYNVIFIAFSIYVQLGAIQMPDSIRMVYNS